MTDGMPAARSRRDLARLLIGLAVGAPLLARPALAAPGGDAVYKLGSGDKLRVTVFGEDDLSGEFEVDGGGSISMPLLGEIAAGGKTIRELEAAVAHKLSDGYLLNPRVNVEVLNYRPFYVLGEVKNPGSYAFVNGMTVLNAVALAGGYTYRARRDHIMVVRGGETGEGTAVDESSAVLPGDIIRVTERLF